MIISYFWWDLFKNLKDAQGEIFYILLLTCFSPLILIVDILILPCEILTLIIYKIIKRKKEKCPK